jgi:hypothetical protein
MHATQVTLGDFSTEFRRDIRLPFEWLYRRAPAEQTGRISFALVPVPLLIAVGACSDGPVSRQAYKITAETPLNSLQVASSEKAENSDNDDKVQSQGDAPAR